MPFVQSAMAGFRQGLESAPVNPIGILIRGVLERHNQIRQQYEQAQVASGFQLQREKELIPLREKSAINLLQEKARLFPPQPKALSGDVAGRLSLASQGEKFAQRAKAILFPLGPQSFQRVIIARTQTPFGIGMIGSQQAQDVEFYIKRAIDAQLRTETGAAVSPGELDRLTKEFMANATADPNSSYTRLNELETGLRKTRTAIDPTGYYAQLTTIPSEDGESEDLTSLSDEDILQAIYQ